MKCQCCGEQRARVSPVESDLIRGNKVLLCTVCRRNNHEPRHLIIIAAQSGKRIREFIVNTRYCGESIPASDVFV